NITNSLISENYITKAVKKEIFSREELASTEIGNLVAIPHTSHNDLEESFISVAILKKPIIWHKEKVQVVLIICIAEKDKHEWKSNLEQLYKSIIELDVVLEIIKSNDFQEFKKIVCKF
ncbi:MAG: PTS sugar transporter subunit IIA, partial [Clostridium sp.]